MFKKCMLFVCCVCGAVSLLAAEDSIIPPNFDWNSPVEKYQSYKDHIDQFKTDPMYADWKINIDVLIALQNKSDKNITYSEFKKFINQIAKQNEYTNKELVPRFTYCVSRFQKFSVDCLKDSEFKDLDYTKWYVTEMACRQGILPYSEIQTILTNTIIELCKIDNMLHIDRCLKLYQDSMVNFDLTTVKTDLKKIRLVMYPKIGDSDQYKKLVIRLELMIKALE